jgi:hypothetical protein
MNRRRFLFNSATSLVGSSLSRGSFAPEIPIKTSWVCFTCGTEYSPATEPPAVCPICEDSRQYVGWQGQHWICMETLTSIYRNTFEEEEPQLHSIHTEPAFAIGQRAFLVETSEGNILWDCVALLDEKTLRKIRGMGGIKAIAISHPHYYTTMIQWSRAFGDAPIFLHSLNRPWVQRPDKRIRFWDGSTLPLPGGLTLVHTGGHFDGYQVLHWPSGASGKGVLLAGDQPEVCSARNWVTFMYSYPNYIPLGPAALRGVVNALEILPFDRLYGAFPCRTVPTAA